MAESDVHLDEVMRHIRLLQDYYRGEQVYVSGILLMYYEQGNPKKFVVPDAFVVKGLSPKKRRIYKIWVERKVPNVVIETTSRKTRRKDMHEKPALYARLGIQEYFLFDPDQEYMDPPLQGHRLVDGVYVRVEPDETGALVSEELELRLKFDQGMLQFFRLDNGQRLLTAEERAERDKQRAAREAQRADREAAAREAAETELAKLREELARRSQS